ncbi:MAG: helix-turn-helix domain-containing protein [Oscillospiraceae bacterium]|nr:helix-turn-helix domain-containing protein [Oscillospiraceae bacterium]
MKYNRYPKRDAIKNYFPLPNELFILDLNAGEISIYSYLLYLENRKTFQCWPSYKTIGKAVDMSQNTVRKYVLSLEDKALITTEPTTVYTKSGKKRNGSLLYTIRPIQEALDLFYARQMARVDDGVAKQRAAEKLAKLAPVSPCEPLCGPLESVASPSPTEDGLSGFKAVSDEKRRTKEKAG